MDPEVKAKELFVWYFNLAIGSIDGDCGAEIESAVEYIIAAAQKPLLKRIEALESKMAQIEAEAEIDFSTRLYKPE